MVASATLSPILGSLNSNLAIGRRLSLIFAKLTKISGFC